MPPWGASIVRDRIALVQAASPCGHLQQEVRNIWTQVVQGE